jgi:hypothetical protein
MTSSATSTETDPARPDSSLQPWHFFMLVSMLAATFAVWRSPDTQPAALLLLSAAIIAAGLVGLALYHALSGFFGGAREPRVVSARVRDELIREKALVLRSIKELEFDRGMGKINEADFAEIGGRLRARALELMQAIDHAAPEPAPLVEAEARARSCPSCSTVNDADAKFCKQCGTKI